MAQTIEDIEFYTIHSWMRKDLGLKGNKRDIYAIIYQQSQGGGSYNGTAQALGNVVGISKRQVLTILSELVEEGLLIKKEHIKNKLKYCEYWAVRPSGEKTSPPDKSDEKTSPVSHKSGEKTSPESGEKTSPNIYIYNNTLVSKKEGAQDEPKSKRKSFNQIIDEMVSDNRIRELLKDYIQMRSLNGKKMTNRALELVIKGLFDLSKDPNEQKKILEKSIKNSWTELYPLAKPKPKNDKPESKNTDVGFKNFSQRDTDLSELEKIIFT